MAGPADMVADASGAALMVRLMGVEERERHAMFKEMFLGGKRCERTPQIEEI